MPPAAPVTALVPAAGIGSRLGLGPKALLRLGGRTLLDVLLETLSPLVQEVLVAYPADYSREFEERFGHLATLVQGGNNRQESIRELIAASAGDILLIQDVARPFPSGRLCADVLEAARSHGAAGAFLDPTVPVGLIDNECVADYRDRTKAGIFQAPQAFRRSLLEAAQASAGDRVYQSTAQMVIGAGTALRVVPGEPENIKITTPLDWEIARTVIGPKLGFA